jgi:hypothetical protein
MTVNTVEVTGSSYFPYQDNWCPRSLWSGRPELAESTKIIDNQVAGVFFRQEFSEYRTLYSEPAPQHFQKKLICQYFQVAGPRWGIFIILIFTIESHGAFKVVVVTKGAWRAGSLEKSPEGREPRQPVKPVNGSEGWGRGRKMGVRHLHLCCLPRSVGSPVVEKGYFLSDQ